MKNVTLLILFIFGFSVNSYSQCQPVKFPTGNNVCLEGPTSDKDICFQNNDGNLNLLFNNVLNNQAENKFSFLKNSVNGVGLASLGIGYSDPKAELHVNGSIAIGKVNTPGYNQSGFRIDYNETTAATYFRNFSAKTDILFTRESYPGVTKNVFGISGDSNNINDDGNYINLYNNNFNNVQISSGNAKPTYFNIRKFGIGTDNPTQQLEVNGNAKFNGSFLYLSPSANDAVIQRTTSGNLVLNSGSGTSALFLNYSNSYGAGSGGVRIYDGADKFARLWITKSGSTALNTLGNTEGSIVISPQYSSAKVIIADDTNLSFKIPSTANYKLIVQSGILTEKVKVALQTTANWSDHVFEENFRLKPLLEVEKYIKENKHLPNIPSSKNLVQEGLDLGEMQAKQMEKIEEITLYLIEMKKEMEQLKKENIELKERILNLKK
jgi:hypothetical protein